MPDNAVVWLDEAVSIHPGSDGRVVVDGLDGRIGRLVLTAGAPGVLFRLAACLMVAADDLTTTKLANAGTPHGGTLVVSR